MTRDCFVERKNETPVKEDRSLTTFTEMDAGSLKYHIVLLEN